MALHRDEAAAVAMVVGPQVAGVVMGYVIDAVPWSISIICGQFTTRRMKVNDCTQVRYVLERDQLFIEAARYGISVDYTDNHGVVHTVENTDWYAQFSANSITYLVRSIRYGVILKTDFVVGHTHEDVDGAYWPQTRGLLVTVDGVQKWVHADVFDMKPPSMLDADDDVVRAPWFAVENDDIGHGI
jgi:hypothetical protein